MRNRKAASAIRREYQKPRFIVKVYDAKLSTRVHSVQCEQMLLFSSGTSGIILSNLINELEKPIEFN